MLYVYNHNHIPSYSLISVVLVVPLLNLPLPRFLPLLRVVIHELLDEVHVRQQHPPAAVPLEAEHVQRVPLRVGGREVVEVRLPLVPYHLAAREAAHGDYHKRPTQKLTTAAAATTTATLSLSLSLSLLFYF